MNHRMIALVLAGLALGACNTPAGSDPGAHGDRVERAPGSADNTRVNERDRSGSTLTPMDQKENAADLQTTADIRKEILKVKDLSTSADNVKIITADGKVTLRGVVKDENEREAVFQVAQRVAGVGKVDNQLEIDTNHM